MTKAEIAMLASDSETGECSRCYENMLSFTSHGSSLPADFRHCAGRNENKQLCPYDDGGNRECDCCRWRRSDCETDALELAAVESGQADGEAMDEEGECLKCGVCITASWNYCGDCRQEIGEALSRNKDGADQEPWSILDVGRPVSGPASERLIAAWWSVVMRGSPASIAQQVERIPRSRWPAEHVAGIEAAIDAWETQAMAPRHHGKTRYHNTLKEVMRERDEALAFVEKMKPVVDAATAVRDAYAYTGSCTKTVEKLVRVLSSAVGKCLRGKRL